MRCPNVKVLFHRISVGCDCSKTWDLGKKKKKLFCSLPCMLTDTQPFHHLCQCISYHDHSQPLWLAAVFSYSQHKKFSFCWWIISSCLAFPSGLLCKGLSSLFLFHQIIRKITRLKKLKWTIHNSWPCPFILIVGYFCAVWSGILSVFPLVHCHVICAVSHAIGLVEFYS